MANLILIMIAVLSLHVHASEPKCEQPTWYKHCKLVGHLVEKGHDAILINLDLQSCDESRSLDLKERIDLADMKLSVADRIENARIWNATASQLDRKLILAEAGGRRITINVSRRRESGCDAHLFQTSESLVVLQ